MHPNGWTKYFLDNSIEKGYDNLVIAKQASWTRGRHDSISHVSIVHNDLFLDVILGPGVWYQQDMMIASVSLENRMPSTIARFVGRQIDVLDIGQHLELSKIGSSYYLTFGTKGSTLDKQYLGWWMVGYLDIEHHDVRYSLFPNKSWRN